MLRSLHLSTFNTNVCIYDIIPKQTEDISPDGIACQGQDKYTSSQISSQVTDPS